MSYQRLVLASLLAASASILIACAGISREGTDKAKEGKDRHEAAVETEPDEPNPAYIKAQAALRDAQAVLREAQARAEQPASQRPPFKTIPGVKLVADDTYDFVPVYASESATRPHFALNAGETADILALDRDRCSVAITSGEHRGERGYVELTNLPLKIRSAVDERFPAKQKVEEAEAVLRNTPKTLREVRALAEAKARRDAEVARQAEAHRLSDAQTCRGTAARQPWGCDLEPIPATVIDKGILRHVPYKSFRAGDYEANVYGDPDEPAGLEVGVYGSAARSQHAKDQCIDFMAAVLNDSADRDVLRSLRLALDIKKRGCLTFEVTPTTAEDSYGGWWVSVYDPTALDRSRASPQELVEITVPKPSSTAREQPAISPQQLASPAASVPIWTPRQYALARPGGKTVYVHSCVRKDGTYVHDHVRGAPGSGSHRSGNHRRR